MLVEWGDFFSMTRYQSRVTAGLYGRCSVLVKGRVWDPAKKKYIQIIEGGVPSAWHSYWDCDKHRIHLNSRESYRSDDIYMDCCVHEALHATFPHLSETTITERTPILKRLLKRMSIGVQPDKP